LLFRKGVPPHATYLFKHALVQDAAYGTLLRQPRRALHARVADTLENQFAEIAEGQPEVLARHCTEAGLIEKAASLWGKAGSRSVGRSALIEALEQFTRGLGQIASLPGTPALRREEIKLQAALLVPLQHVKGIAAPETTAAAERARRLIEQAEAIGEPPEDPLLLFLVLGALLLASLAAFNGDLLRARAAEILALAEKKGGKIPLHIGQTCVGGSLLWTGNFAESLPHFNQALALYDPVELRPLLTRFSSDNRVGILCYRSIALWALGYPKAARAGTEQALSEAREIGHAATLFATMAGASITQLISGDFAAAQEQSNELVALAEARRSIYWKAVGMMRRASVLALTGKPSDAIGIFTLVIPAWRATGTTNYLPIYLSLLAKACGELGRFDDAWSYIDDAAVTVERTKETWYEAEVHRIAGEIALMSPEPDPAKAEACFERALAVARSQQAKSWELRAATSMARLWRDQGKRRGRCG
jgi:tetratricopeptide (TPR) repeat protein